ncbi:MAG: dockerin type I repeat-containing protein [Ruminococcus sp.]|nr:dockerin type I repeat-containing protein [Ruminococcus sp.]
MKRLLTKAVSALTCTALLGGLLAAFPAAAVDEEFKPEITGYASLTTNVYNEDTGELFGEDEVMLKLEAVTELGREKGVSTGLDGWFVNESNPRIRDTVPVSPEWSYYYLISWNEYDSYYYTIDYDKTAEGFTLEDGEEKQVDIYLKKKYKAGVFNSFFVYIGNETAEGHPTFIQFYPASEENPSVLRKKQLTYLGEIGGDAQYGDIYKTDEPIVTHGSVTEQKLEPLENFRKTGSVYESCERETLRVTSVSTETGLKPSIDTLKLRMDAGEAGYYNYSLKLKELDYPYNFDDLRVGDTIEFFMLEDKLIVPTGEYVHVPKFMGDLNDDRDLTVADVVLMQKWLLGSADVKMSDWTAVDYCKDGVLDEYDLILMRQALIEELSKPHTIMKVLTTYGGYGIAGQDLGSGEYTQEFTVKKGDWFVEPYGGDWLKNEPLYTDYEQGSVIVKITDITDEGVSFIAKENDYRSDDKEYTVKYTDEPQHIDSLHVVFDGTNFDYDVSFNDVKAE